MARSTSTKKAAKLAEKRSGRTIRFQGGAVFPIAVALTLIIGLGLIVYGRSTLPDANSSPPTINDHWHAAYGIYLCDGWVQLNGNLEDVDANGQLVSDRYRRTAIHSHDDGVMHWHPNSSLAVGKNAVIGVFLENYGVELSNDRLAFPSTSAVGPNPNYANLAPSEILDEYVEGETKCNGEDASLSVRAWKSFSDTDSGKRYIANMDRVHVDQDGMVFAIYFAADDADQTMPPWAVDLPQLGGLDTDQILPGDLLQSDTTTEDSTTEDSTTEDSTTEVTTTEVTTTEDSTTEVTTEVTTTVAGG